MISEFYNEDCEIGMKRYPDKFWNLAIVDPPYGIGEDSRKTKGRALSKNGIIKKYDKRNGRQIIVKPKNYIGGLYDDKQPDQSYFNELFRTSKRHVIFGSNYLKFTQKNNSTGRIFWDKVNGDCDFSDGEIAWTNLFSSVRQLEYMWNGMFEAENVSNGRKYCGIPNREKRIHPNHKPIALYKWLLNNYAKPGDKILDTHTGSGSSRIACWDLGFDFYGWELDPDYYKSAEERFQNHISKYTIDEKKNHAAEAYIQMKLEL